VYFDRSIVNILSYHQAYLRAKTKNASQYHLIPGALSVFSDNFFIASSELPPTPPDAEFDVFLGIDPDVKVID
jgi:hypothetical protein